MDSSQKSLIDTIKPFDPDNSNNRDLIDVMHHIFANHKHPHGYTWKEKTGRSHLAAIPAAGYTLQTGFAGLLSANLAFYTTENEKAKISSLLTSITYSQYSQTIFPIQADIWTKNDNYNVIVDWRYLNYPSTTFGLGGHTDITDGYTIDFSYIKLHQSILKKFRQDLYFGIGYYYDYLWDIKEIDPPTGVISNMQRYGYKAKSTSSGIALRGIYDTRTNQVNPEGGWFVNTVFRPNFKWMGSDNNWESLLLEVRKYWKVSKSSPNILAFWSYNWLTTKGKPPYLLLPSTGWDDSYNTGRGYIQGRYRGKDMVYAEAEYRFKISRNGLLGGVAFANAESVSKTLNTELQTIAPGFGGGIRIKLNKHSGANLCLDYGFAPDGSGGFFVNLGEVF